jgi:hypothetical protein
MLKLRSENTDDETLLLAFAATAGEAVDPKIVLSILDRLFATAEYDDHDEYIINTMGVVPKQPGPERNKMWTWIERIEKRLGIEVEVWGSNGEYLTPTTLNGRTYSSDDFGSEENFNYVERDLAASFRELVEFHRAWRMFASSTARSKKEAKRP